MVAGGAAKRARLWRAQRRAQRAHRRARRLRRAVAVTDDVRHSGSRTPLLSLLGEASVRGGVCGEGGEKRGVGVTCWTCRPQRHSTRCTRRTERRRGVFVVEVQCAKFEEGSWRSYRRVKLPANPFSGLMLLTLNMIAFLRLRQFYLVPSERNEHTKSTSSGGCDGTKKGAGLPTAIP